MQNRTQLSEAAKEARRAYHREWQRNNREKCNGYLKNYWERKAKEEQERG